MVVRVVEVVGFGLVVVVVGVVEVVGFELVVVVVGFGLLKSLSSNLSGANFAACLLAQEAPRCNAFSNSWTFSS